MRLAAPTISLLALACALAGCQSFGPPPDLSAVPHATLVGSHVDVNSDRIDTFRALTIDGHNVLPISDRPYELFGRDRTDLLAAGRGVRVEIEGLAFYNNTMRRVFWDPMHVQGVVEFVPVAGAKYVVNGLASPDVSSVWIENAATHEVVGRKLSAPGRGASAPEAASAPAQS